MAETTVRGFFVDSMLAPCSSEAERRRCVSMREPSLIKAFASHIEGRLLWHDTLGPADTGMVTGTIDDTIEQQVVD